MPLRNRCNRFLILLSAVNALGRRKSTASDTSHALTPDGASAILPCLVKVKRMTRNGHFLLTSYPQNVESQ